MFGKSITGSGDTGLGIIGLTGRGLDLGVRWEREEGGESISIMKLIVERGKWGHVLCQRLMVAKPKQRMEK